MPEEQKEENEKLIKDPYLKPVILGGLTIAFLSLVFAPGIFIWAVIGGYVTVRLSYKLTKEIASIRDSLLLGIFSGVVGATCVNLLTIMSFNNPENHRTLIKTLERSWPKDMYPLPDFNEILPSIFFTACILITVVSVIFSMLGSYTGLLLTKKKSKEGS